MPSWTPRLAALVLFALPASAQSTVQLMLSGSIRNTTGCVDFEFGVRGPDGTEATAVSLHMALLQNTSALDVANLLAVRLSDAKIRHATPPAGTDRNLATIFVDGLTRLQIRVGDGLQATIGLPDGAPTSVLMMPPLARAGKARLFVHGVTNDARLRKRGAIEFGVDLQPDTTPTLAVESLANACARANWLSERPTHETWKPSPSFEGQDLVGTSFALDTSESDWGIELRLP